MYSWSLAEYRVARTVQSDTKRLFFAERAKVTSIIEVAFALLNICVEPTDRKFE